MLGSVQDAKHKININGVAGRGSRAQNLYHFLSFTRLHNLSGYTDFTETSCVFAILIDK